MAHSEIVVGGVASQYGKVGSQWFSWDGDYNAIVHKDVHWHVY